MKERKYLIYKGRHVHLPRTFLGDSRPKRHRIRVRLNSKKHIKVDTLLFLYCHPKSLKTNILTQLHRPLHLLYSKSHSHFFFNSY